MGFEHERSRSLVDAEVTVKVTPIVKTLGLQPLARRSSSAAVAWSALVTCTFRAAAKSLSRST